MPFTLYLSRSKTALVMSLIIASSLLIGVGKAEAADQYGTPSIAYSGVANPPTSDKPQSKLWWNDGSWWADMWKTGTGWSIFRLDRSAQSWVDTGVTNDIRGSTLADTLWDGTHLYIASHVVTITGDGTPKPSITEQPAYLYRYSYSEGSYTLDAGFPTVITDNSSESMTIDIDSRGGLWATWTQVGGNTATGFTNSVYINYAADSGANWLTPFLLPVANPNPAPDDISAVVAFSKSQIGVMWSDHRADTVWWATHKDGEAATEGWKVQPALRGKGQSDDHLNLKTLQADSSGRVFAAVKTSLNDSSTDPSLPQLLLLVFRPGTAAFSQSTISVTGDCVSRPQIVLDTANNLVRAFQTAPPNSVSGCAYSGVAGSIYEKTAPLDNPVFGPGRGTPIMQSPSSSNINDVTTTKQSVDASTGLVVLASDNVAKRYWFSDRPLGSVPQPPAASFTATPSTGTVPLTITFTDTSLGGPTSWTWNFGDESTSTDQNPVHTYLAAGTYTVRLTATNNAGSTSTISTVDVVQPAPPASRITVVGSTSTTAGTAARTVTLQTPAGTTAGDVLIASLTGDFNPSLTSVPEGWTPIMNPLSINSSATTGARSFVYLHVAGPAEPLMTTWTFDKSVKLGAGVTTYRGVNTATPLDSPTVTAVDVTYTAKSITAASITTASDGAMLIGGAACDCGAQAFTPPDGWTERFEAEGQIAEQADKTQTTPGPSGTATWSMSGARAAAVWRTALKPIS
ncbi:PKD domain-containing protein [Arthrobacter sp. AD-310]